MASLLTNGITTFSPHSSLKTTKPLNEFPPKFVFLKNPSLKPRDFKLVVRADVGEKSQTTTSKSSSCIDTIQKFLNMDNKHEFASDIESVSIPKGLSVDTIRLISSKKGEPEWMLEFRLKSYEKFSNMKVPQWSDNRYPLIDLQDMCYYSEPKKKDDPRVSKEFGNVGVPLNGLGNVAYDAVFDSVSVATTHRKPLADKGVIFCPISEAAREYPDLVRKYLGKVVPPEDNYYAALNSAVFSDGTFCYIPKGTKCPIPISTYFLINARETGQFERTLIVADEGSSMEYMEGCTAPFNDRNQLHAAVVELYTEEGAEIKYSTVQNWDAGDKKGIGGVYNFVTKRGLCSGARSKISWTQVETGSAITWKYPSVILEGDDTVGEFYSVAVTKNYQQADTGTKMIHKGKNTKSTIVSKGISAGNSRNCYRGLVQVQSKAENARNISQCDSMLIGNCAAANTYPYIQAKNPSARIEHEASTSKIGEEQLFYFQQRGIDLKKAVKAMISGFCQDVFNKLPNEFGADFNEIMSINLEGSVG